MTSLIFVGILLCQIIYSFAFTKDDCSQYVENGNCGNFQNVYYWNEATQRCDAAMYGGCQPTRNNFKTKQDCEEVAAPICKDNLEGAFTVEDCVKDVQKRPAKCLAGIRVYKWDHIKQSCVLTVYGGCRSTKNNFRTFEQCMKIARPVCKNNRHMRLFQLEDCDKNVEEGSVQCRARIPVFKWDQKQQKCVGTFYGGCHGTNNNFRTREECEKLARPVCEQHQPENIFKHEDCTKGVEDGSVQCRARIPVYQWDDNHQQCVVAFYGGCNATHNNFKRIEDCQKYAEPICRKQY